MKFQRNFWTLLVLPLCSLAFAGASSADSLEILKDESVPQARSDSSEAYLEYLQQLEPTAAGEESHVKDKEKDLRDSVKAFDKTNATQGQSESSLQPYDFIE